MSEPFPKAESERLLDESVRDVGDDVLHLSGRCAPEEPQSADGPIVEIRFRGNPPGVFHLRLGERAGRELAAAFMGAEDPGALTGGDVENVLCELANVICGRALSRIESDSTFDLGAPVVVTGAALERGEAGADCVVPLDAGPVEVWLWLEGPQ